MAEIRVWPTKLDPLLIKKKKKGRKLKVKVCLSWPWSLPSNWGCTTGLCLCHISMMHLQQQLHPVLYHCDSVTVHFSTYSSPLGSTWQHASESVPITGSKVYCNTRFLSKYNTIGFICVFSNFSLNRKEKRVEQDFFFPWKMQVQ